MQPPQDQVTRLLNHAGEGDPQAAADLLPLVYDELRALARRRIGRERPDQTLQATALVHEAYIRLVDAQTLRKWDSRGHFFAAAAEAMRRILVDRARRRHRLKRGGGARRIDLDDLSLAVEPPARDLIALDDALARLDGEHPQHAQLVKLRYFAGLTVEDAAEVMGISPTTAKRHWAYARAWLYDEIESARGKTPPPEHT
jgi:RNA polymerase sigma factor (TIGR02999 family)